MHSQSDSTRFHDREYQRQLTDRARHNHYKETLTIAVIIWSNSPTHSFRSHVGTGSRLQDLLGDVMMRVFTSSSGAWVNLSSGVFTDEVSTSWSIPCMGSVWRSRRMFCILSIKKELNISVSSMGDPVWGRDVDPLLPIRCLATLYMPFWSWARAAIFSE